VHGIAVLAKAGQHGVPRFVIRRTALIRFGDDAAALRVNKVRIEIKDRKDED